MVLSNYSLKPNILLDLIKPPKVTTNNLVNW